MKVYVVISAIPQPYDKMAQRFLGRCVPVFTTDHELNVWVVGTNEPAASIASSFGFTEEGRIEGVVQEISPRIDISGFGSKNAWESLRLWAKIS